MLSFFKRLQQASNRLHVQKQEQQDAREEADRKEHQIVINAREFLRRGAAGEVGFSPKYFDSYGEWGPYIRSLYAAGSPLILVKMYDAERAYDLYVTLPHHKATQRRLLIAIGDSGRHARVTLSRGNIAHIVFV